MKRTHVSGFTIVELLTIITIIAVLAGITIFAFGSWRIRTAQTEMKNELYAAATSLKNFRNFTNNYPADLAAMSYSGNSNVVLNYTLRADGLSYCLNAGSTGLPTEPHWYIDSSTATPTTTACS